MTRRNKRTRRLTTRGERIPLAWQTLFLTVADAVDGGQWDKRMKEELRAVYERILATRLGQRLYAQAVEQSRAQFMDTYTNHAK